MKTTVTGYALALAALEAIERSGGDLTKWRTWIIPVGIAVFGHLVPDKAKKPKKTKP